MKEPLRLWMPDDKGEMQLTLLEDEHAEQYVYLDDYRELESKLDECEEAKLRERDYAAGRIKDLESRLNEVLADRSAAREHLQRERDRADEAASRLDGLLHILRNANRIGEASDVPEGSRYIQLSNTLVAQMLDDKLPNEPMAAGSVRVVERRMHKMTPRLCHNCRFFSLKVMTGDPGPEHDSGKCFVNHPEVAWVSAVYVCERWELEPSMATDSAANTPK